MLTPATLQPVPGSVPSFPTASINVIVPLIDFAKPIASSPLKFACVHVTSPAETMVASDKLLYIT